MSGRRPARRGEVALQIVDSSRLQPIALVAIVAGVVMAAVARLKGPVAVGALVLFCFGITVVDGIGKQRFSLRQLVVFLLTVGAGLVAWGIAVTLLLGVVDLPTGADVQAVLIAGAACIAGALVVFVVKTVIGRRTVTPLSVRKGLKQPQPSGFEGSAKGKTKA